MGEGPPEQHGVDVLRTMVSVQQQAQRTATVAEGKADLAIQQGTHLVGRVAVLEDRTKTLDGKLDRVLERLAEGMWDRALKRLVYGLVALWLVAQFLAARGLP